VYYSITLPRTLGANDTIILAVDTIESHAAHPLPPTLKQSETQSLVHETVALVTSPYATANQLTKIRSETPQIHSFSQPKSLQRFASGEVATKTGSILTYGPFVGLPASDSPLFAETIQAAIKIHFEYNHPILTLSTLRRVAEISHWGANLNIQDDINLRNDAAV
jgi:oligosaccharyltransferase complex subunit alpha (ribophorin I)